jgi:pyruvate/2-oxoglutarate dehydrogenase complex dihydrolipoamide dehydrogenase (E3) component
LTVEQYDAIVIGAGQSGGPMTSTLTANGLKTAIIERRHVGGSCINFGCTPTKTMFASARVAHVARRAADFGVNTGAVTVDLAAVRARQRDIVKMFREGSLNAILSTEGLDLIEGHARFTGHKTIEVSLNDGGIRTLQAEKIFVNTGTRSSFPPIDGLGDVPAMSSTDMLELDDVPEHLLVLGGGYIGLEFGQMFRRFGSQVTIMQRGPQLLKDEDRDIAEAIRDILIDDGITVMLDANMDAVRQDPDGSIIVSGNQNGTAVEVRGSHFLVATGRQPNTDELEAEKTGLELDRAGFIPANERLETNVPGIWVLGDVKGGPAFTHISYDDYRILTTNLFQGGNRTICDRQTPYVAFTDPELARVGLSERAARDADYDIKVARMEMSAVARAIESDETRGVMKAVIDARTDRILGAAILGIGGGELISLIHLAIITKTPYTTLRDMVLSHPTVSESMNNLFADVG